jgi:hypothetical protein
VQVVDGEQHAVGDPVAARKVPPASAAAATPPEEKLLADHVENGEHDDHGEPAPRSAEEILTAV